MQIRALKGLEQVTEYLQPHPIQVISAAAGKICKTYCSMAHTPSSPPVCRHPERLTVTLIKHVMENIYSFTISKSHKISEKC